ncbi:ATP-binding protein [Anabaena cylindrica FACHB-243]|nr:MULTISPECIES: ATP-binding protein [Anabaena]MBD2420201.1 ATP-binding protein [Anabaena cylindrica FACHB-243]MBY5283072.1 ATP-binding protein [Anabaena sp. CCAP 1446/1C]MBY5306631.1 ATP-binding protein [Anabaena sp. CCAP 1446/1C]MCM2406146.1 ATP-binding protein [Anabaena sp. CCAP 1446/1C]
MFLESTLPAHICNYNQLLLLLEKLDQLLENAIAAAEVAYGSEAANNPYQGIQINDEEVERLLERKPGIPILTIKETAVQEFSADIIQENSRLAWLQEIFGLSDFDINIIAIALAPELDRRYERLYAYLQDDVRCKRPTVDLALNLLCTSAIEKLTRRVHFSADAPLIRHGLLHLYPESHQTDPPLLAHNIKLDTQVIQVLLGETAIDSRLLSFCQLITPKLNLDQLPLKFEIKQGLISVITTNSQAGLPLNLYFPGEDTSGKRHTAEAITKSLRVPLLIAELARIAEAKAEFTTNIKLLFREALFKNALLYIEDLDVLQTKENAILYDSFIQQLKAYPIVTIIAGVKAGVNTATKAIEVMTIPFVMPNFEQRRFYWQNYLQAADITLNDIELDSLSDRFRLTSEQIANAVATATNQAGWESAVLGFTDTKLTSQQPISLTDLFTAARGLSGQDLATLARHIQPKYAWEDIVLPDNQKNLLREICNQVKHQHLVWEKWGFESKLSLGRGLNVMFSGTSGTGKTMAAEIIAQELQLDLYKIDLSQVVSKYIGETEKNLNHIFTAATNANAILLFDEADALFGKRSEVKDAHDRYANLEISYLLQKMEEYEGITILTTNLRMNMDDAFVRRLRFIVEFPFPNEKQRYQIWQKIFPTSAPCSPEIDLNFLARNFELTGANIRNIALTAAFLSADDSNQIEMSHLIQAIRREYQKMGKILKDKELGRVGSNSF